MSAAELAAITGLPPEEAAQYLEMAGGNLEAAVTLFFDMAGGGGDVTMGDFGGMGSPTFAPPTPAHGILFGDDAAPAAWLEQGFQFSEDPTACIGIVQHKNGPCGVLAAVNGVIVAQADCPQASTVVTDDMLSSALATILVRCASAKSGTMDDSVSTRVVVASWLGDHTSNKVEETELPVDKIVVASHLKAMIPSLKGPGGAVLFCYSAVLSRGLDKVRAESVLDGGRPPLVVGPHSLCGTELMGLFMFGIARGNVGAYDGADGTKIKWRSKEEVGMLSRDENDMGIPLADELKCPSKPVYVIHGGDHFTLLWATAVVGDSVDFIHWNGLAPNRAMIALRLTNASLEPRLAPERHVQTHWRIKVGEVESIVQASPTDKAARPSCWRTHAYELALATQAVVDEDKSEERPGELDSPPTFEQGPLPTEGATWRCLSCYQTRFKTMCFGENSSPSERACKFCTMDIENSGWTIWKRYHELPVPLQRRIDRTSGPKILAVLRTRWPDAELCLFRSDGTIQTMGDEGFDAKDFVTPIA